MLAEHRRDLPPAVDPAQLDLPAGHEAKEQDQCGVLGRQRALRLHAAPEFLVEPLDRIRGSQRLPLGAWEPEEREQFVTAFPQAPTTIAFPGSEMVILGGWLYSSRKFLSISSASQYTTFRFAW